MANTDKVSIHGSSNSVWYLQCNHFEFPFDLVRLRFFFAAFCFSCIVSHYYSCLLSTYFWCCDILSMGFPNVYGKMLLTFYGKPFWWSHFAQTMQIENSNSEIEQKWLFRPTFSMHVKKRKKKQKGKTRKINENGRKGLFQSEWHRFHAKWEHRKHC